MPCLTAMPLTTAGLYVHIPFCRSKCGYCSFFSLPVAGWDTGGYLAAVGKQAEMLARHPWTEEQCFQSLYIGGGTPTVCNAEQLARLLKACLSLFPFVDAPEVSVEANPTSVDQRSLETLREAGANRISIGVQSFSDPILAALGRPHRGKDALHAVRLARAAGFTNLNIDLMYGCPGQSATDWATTLDTALALRPEHIALYELTIEEDTPFAAAFQAGSLVLPTEEELLAMEEATCALTMSAGFERYEISNYAIPGAESRHNSNYWENGSYVGLGAGGVSNFSGLRLKAIADPSRFMELTAEGRSPFIEGEALSLEASFRESVVIGMRMTAGVSIPRLFSLYGLDPTDYYGTVLAELLHQGLVMIEGEHLRLTRVGQPVANRILARLV